MYQRFIKLALKKGFSVHITSKGQETLYWNDNYHEIIKAIDIMEVCVVHFYADGDRHGVAIIKPDTDNPSNTNIMTLCTSNYACDEWHELIKETEGVTPCASRNARGNWDELVREMEDK